jgi:hypothetical protein
MFIKKVDFNLYDCFDGNGWDNWVRMELQGDGLWYVIAGSRLYAERAAFFLNRKLKG